MGHTCTQLPFHFDQIKSSNESVLNSPQAWSNVKSIEFGECFRFCSNLTEQLQLKMPNLTSMVFTSHLISHLPTDVADINQIDRALNSVTTVHCSTEWLQPLKKWLFRFVPDVRCLMLSHNPPLEEFFPNGVRVSRRFDRYLSEKKMTTDHFYPFKIHYAEIEVTLHKVDAIYQHVVELLKELLEMSESLQSITFHFHHLPRFPMIIPYNDLGKTIKLFSMGKFCETYRIKHVQNYMEFVRKMD